MHIILSIALIIASYLFFVPNVYNFMVRNFAALDTGSKDIVLVVIDDKSVDTLRWPWKREVYAKIFNYLNEFSQTKVIGFDSLPAAPDNEDPQSDLTFYNSLARTKNLVVGFAPSISNSSTEEKYNNKFANKFSISVTDNRTYKPQSKYNSIFKYPDEYFNSVFQAGSVNNTPNINGYLVQADQLVEVKDKFFASLALRMYLAITKSDSITIDNSKLTIDKTKIEIPGFSTQNGFQNSIQFHFAVPFYF